MVYGMSAKSERFEFRMGEEQISRVEAWALEQSDHPTRAEAVRRLIDLGLSAGSSRAVNFSDGEKMLILMMGDLFKALKIKDPGSNPNFLAEVIYGGHYWAPKWDMQGVFHDHIDNPQDVTYVCDVLDMWSFIEEAYSQLSSEQKQAITSEVGTWANDIKFSGFDGNNETSQMSIAGFLINVMGRFTRFKGRDLNAHHPTNDRYRQMLALFEPMRPSLVGGGLSIKQLVALLKR
jgi:uncharacterized protein YfbU (UPF0304 family)